MARKSSTGIINYQPHPEFIAGRVVSFTATRVPPRGPAADLMREHLDGLDLARGFITGGCVGGDHFIGAYLAHRFPRHPHTVIVPADRSRVAPWWREEFPGRVHVIEMPPGTDYRARNLRMVHESERLLAYPMYPEADERSRRSGSWMTIRMARREHDEQPLVFPITRLNRIAERVGDQT